MYLLLLLPGHLLLLLHLMVWLLLGRLIHGVQAFVYLFFSKNGCGSRKSLEGCFNS